MEDYLPLVVAIVGVLAALLGAVVGAGAAFGGVVYSERRVTERNKASAERADQRDTIRRLQDTYLEYETAGDEIFIMLAADWNSQPRASRVWHGRDQSSEPWQGWAGRSRLVTALRSELNDRALADAVYAVQEELKAILTEGPVSASDADSAAFKERVNGRRAGTQSLIEDIGAAYRSL